MANYGFGLSQDAIKVLGDAQQYRQRLGMENAQMLNSLSAAQLQNRMNAQQANASYGFEDPNLVNQVNVPQALQNYMGGQGNNAQQAAPGLEQGLPVGTASAVQAPRGVAPMQGQAMSPQQGQAGMPPQGQAGLPMRANPYDVAQARQIMENQNNLERAIQERKMQTETLLGVAGLKGKTELTKEELASAAQKYAADQKLKGSLAHTAALKSTLPKTPEEQSLIDQNKHLNAIITPDPNSGKISFTSPAQQEAAKQAAKLQFDQNVQRLQQIQSEKTQGKSTRVSSAPATPDSQVLLDYYTKHNVPFKDRTPENDALILKASKGK